MTAVLHNYPKGNVELNLKIVDNIPFTNFTIAESRSDSPIQLNFKYDTFTMSGIENCTFTDAKGFDRDPEKSKVEIKGYLPQVILYGDYVAKGKLLLLPLNGHGKGLIKIKNMKFTFKSRFSTETRADGKRYVRFVKVRTRTTGDQSVL